MEVGVEEPTTARTVKIKSKLAHPRLKRTPCEMKRWLRAWLGTRPLVWTPKLGDKLKSRTISHS